ncbi:MAG: DEAD/DEAH box helicase [Nanoarchaeota archaeon]
MLKDFTPRLYQETIFATCVNHNTLVVLPTGLGKTAIAVLLAIQRLSAYPDSKILFFAPTRPLVLQHLTTFQKITTHPPETYAVFTGMIPPAKRTALWDSARIIFSTPQGMENDIINKNISLDKVSLIIFDEAHRATGDYAYVFIAKKYAETGPYPRILGLTASPGGNEEEIRDVMRALFIEKVEVRTEADPDVRDYVQEIDIEWVKVALPEKIQAIKRYLDSSFQEKINALKQETHIKGDFWSKTALLSLQSEIQAKIAQGEKDYSLLRALSLSAEAMKVSHAIELCETQGIYSLLEYLGKLEEQARTTKTKATQNLMKDNNFRSAKLLAEELKEGGIEHPKLAKLLDILKKEATPTSKIIIFTQYRDQADTIKSLLEKNKISAKIFVGQQKRKTAGLTQKEQKKILEEFEQGKFTCLIATSVAEEGLDIPKVDCVIFYEPVPSAIRTVQRRGRTGRLEKGKVFILVTRGTRDENYRWSSQAKEKKMITTLKGFKGVQMEKQPQQTLVTYTDEPQIKIYTDYREKGSGLLKELLSRGADISLKRLEVGDYLLSERVCVEIKKVPDFVDSILDGRLLSQMKDIRQYERPLVIIEGEEDLFSQRNIHQNAILGMISTITIGFNIPLIRTKNHRETAAFLLVTAKQEQIPSAAHQFHTAKPLTIKEQQEFIISSFPGIGTILAKPLLEAFGSVENIIKATEEELRQVPLIGPIKAKRIKDVLTFPYGRKV